jgi:hypothetical protein
MIRRFSLSPDAATRGSRPAPASPPLDPTMDSLRTAFRLVVMLAALGIGYKAWQLYGPPTEQLQALALRALDAARTALESRAQNDGSAAALTADPRPIAPAFGAPALSPVAPGQVMQAQALVPSGELPTPVPITPPALAPSPSRLPTVDSSTLAEPPAKNASATVETDDAQLQSLYTQLEQLGAHNWRLLEWGSDGQLYRFTCRVSLAGAANFNQHFEAVANSQKAAIEAVLAKVTAWRTAQRNTGEAETILR